jgi:hypothetical protein
MLIRTDVLAYVRFAQRPNEKVGRAEARSPSETTASEALAEPWRPLVLLPQARRPATQRLPELPSDRLP